MKKSKRSAKFAAITFLTLIALSPTSKADNLAVSDKEAASVTYEEIPSMSVEEICEIINAATEEVKKASSDAEIKRICEVLDTVEETYGNDDVELFDIDKKMLQNTFANFIIAGATRQVELLIGGNCDDKMLDTISVESNKLVLRVLSNSDTLKELFSNMKNMPRTDF